MKAFIVPQRLSMQIDDAIQKRSRGNGKKKVLEIAISQHSGVFRVSGELGHRVLY